MYRQKLILENLLCIVKGCLWISCLLLRVSVTLYCVASVCWMLLLGRTTHECKYWGGCKLNVVTQLQKYEINCLLVYVELHMCIVPHSSASAPVSFVCWLIPPYLTFQCPSCYSPAVLPNLHCQLTLSFPISSTLVRVYVHAKHDTFANSAFLGGRVRVGISEQRKINRRSKALLSLWWQTWTSLKFGVNLSLVLIHSSTKKCQQSGNSIRVGIILKWV